MGAGEGTGISPRANQEQVGEGEERDTLKAARNMCQARIHRDPATERGGETIRQCDNSRDSTN